MSRKLKDFINPQQLSLTQSLTTGEEGNYFVEVLTSIQHTLNTMPVSYETEGQGMDAVAYLHYFLGGSDWWITEIDSEEEQYQAFGYVCLHGGTDNAEFGYVDIVELLRVGAELDYYWVPMSLRDVLELERGGC